MTESRLDRLLKLIDTAQSSAYRRLAAKQLGSLVQSQPNQARPLLQMLEGMLFSKNWDTRIACAFAVEYIFTALPSQFTDNCASDTDKITNADGQLLKELDLATEIRSRKALLASAGAEFDLDLTISAAERLKISRANVKRTLGFDGISGMEELERELVKDEDLSASSSSSSVPSALPVVAEVDLEKLSARERIAMKRKARLKSSQEQPNLKQQKKSSEALPSTETSLGLESTESIESDALWFCERMKEKLLNPNWYVRHGALLGLRGVLGRGIPVMSEVDAKLLSETQEGWLDFVLCDILLILGLDRFGDFIGDQVVSPVKETAAQLFALIYKRLSGDKGECLVTRHISVLMGFEEWQVRHAGLLSLKHILLNVADVPMAACMCGRVVELLSDGDEDVRSVAAEVLSSLLASNRHTSIDLQDAFKRLQGLLGDLDEVSPSVAPVLDLLGHLVGLDASFQVQSELLLPFLRHSSGKVRRQVVRVLGALNLGDDLQVILLHLIQSLAIELDREISDLTLSLVLDLITISGDVCCMSVGRLDALFDIVSCPLGREYSVSSFEFHGGAPAGHDLAFKKSDMMLIGEEEGILQRMNVSRALKALLPGALGGFDAEKWRKSFSTSSWCIHKLVHLWIFGPLREAKEQNVSFNESSSLLGSLQAEYQRFCNVIGCTSSGSFEVSLVTQTIEGFRTRSEKSVEALNQLTVLEGVLSQFEKENAKLHARLLVVCEASSDLEKDDYSSQHQRFLIEALKVDENARLQEFYAKDLVETLEKNVDGLLTLPLLEDLGSFLDLNRLAHGNEKDTGSCSDNEIVISAQKEWIDYQRTDDSLWRAGLFVFKEFSGSAVLVSKSLSLLRSVTDHATNCWLVGLLHAIKDGSLGGLVIDKVSLDLFDFARNGPVSSVLVSSWAFAFSQLVRLEATCNSSASLERFVHDFLFCADLKADRVFPVVLELLNRVATGDGSALLPLVPVFLKRTLTDINDSQASVRKYASLTFSQLIRLAPLAGDHGTVASCSFVPSAKTVELIGECREFLEQLQGPSTALPDFVPTCPLNVTMRPYQQAGLNWLAFLRRFNLHGALCDDMGLGKTLQTLSIIASDHYENGSPGKARLRSLIVCPASLTGHWDAEIRQYCPTLSETPLLYVGSASQRHSQSMQKLLSAAEIVVTSYDVLRSDFEHLHGGETGWNYCVLDEGHLIKNPRTKLSAAVRTLKAKHRLLLSGTPIQNNLLELWALFDFLLPGYLGTEKEFTDRYAKPILILQHQQSISNSSNTTNSSDGNLSKWTQKDFDEAERRLAALHKQVLPFILRRMKEDVLSDLPPKIIQYYKCPMSSVQRILYDHLLAGSGIRTEISKYVKEKFVNEGAIQDVVVVSEGGDNEVSLEPSDISSVSSSDISSVISSVNVVNDQLQKPKPKSSNATPPLHVFQVLQYLRKLCVHPSLVLSPSNQHPMMAEIDAELQRTRSKLTDLSVAPKFQMLKELLVECGLGSGCGENEDSGINGGGHRVLIFAQHKSTLDLIEELVFRPHLPGLSFLRLDGGVEASARYPIVSKFNSDMTIDVLLLTTHVGGLGLNLTTADTVIFMDPDWNPMKDLQAMDRAHRLGQKRVVTVYRLLLQDTLEDRIMSLQRWKTRVASTVITQQNSEATNHENLLDLFDDSSSGKVGKAAKNTDSTTTGAPAWHVDDDSDLARREEEYKDEFDH